MRAFAQGRVRYLIAGGLAVVAHGYVRFTADVDLVLDLDPENLERAVAALSRLGYRPRAPVALAEFADAAQRALWAREKGMKVFSVHSSEHPATEVDLFLEPPVDFDQAYARSVSFEVAPGLMASFVGLDDLLDMKRRADRPVDRHDIEQLESLRRTREGEP